MLKHSEKYLSGYLDGELDVRQKKAVEEHLLSCRACADRLEKLKITKNAVSVYSEFTKPGALPVSLVYGHRKIISAKQPVYETVGYKLGLALFMNVFMLKIGSFSRAWLMILGLYTLFHLVLYVTANVRRVRRLGIA